jgi:hypothetical protein
LEIEECVAVRDKHDHRDIEGRQILLVLEFPIDGQEDIEFSLGKTQQLAVSLACPAHFRRGSDVVAD